MRVLRDIALLIARVILGAVLVLHGWQRWQIDGIARQVDELTRLGAPSPTAFAWGATILELAGGVLLIFGALTPLVAVLIMIESVLIVVFVSGPNGPMLGNGGFEYSAVIFALALLLLVFGAGRAAVDQLFRRPPEEPTSTAPSYREDDPA